MFGKAQIHKTVVTSDTTLGLIDSLKASIWSKLNEDGSQDKFNTQIDINDLSFVQTSDGQYIASYSLDLKVAKHQEKETQLKDDDDGIEL